MNNRLALFGLIALVLLTVAYAGHFENTFHFDDVHTIEHNPFIRDVGNIPLFFKDASTFSTMPTHQTYRPMVSTILAIDYWMAGNELNPKVIHASIYIFYVIQLILMYFLLLKIANKIFTSETSNKWFAFGGVAFYAFHVANAETINYMIALSDSFSTLMVVAAFGVYLYANGWKKALFLIPFILGILTKRTALMFAPIFFTYVVLFEKEISLKEIFSSKIFRRPTAGLKYTSKSILVALLGYYFVGEMTSDEFTPGGTSVYQYAITQPYVLFSYVKTFFFPIDLSADTDWVTFDGINFKAIVGFLFVGAMVWLAFKTSSTKKWRPVAFGIAWFLFALLPTSSLIPLAEVKNDHRLFFPYIGLAIAFSWSIYILVLKHSEKLILNPTNRTILFGLFGVIILSHTYGVTERNKVWKTQESLWKDVTIKSPKNARGWMNYGLTFLRRNEFQEALNNFQKAEELLPNYALLHAYIAAAKNGLNAPDQEIEARYKKAIGLRHPDEPATLFYFAHWLHEKGRSEEASLLLEECIRIQPAHGQARSLLMYCYKSIGEFQKLKDLANQTLLIFPQNQQAHEFKNFDVNTPFVDANLPTEEMFLEKSFKKYQEGDFRGCIELCKKALEINPNSSGAYNNICSSYNQLQEWNKAVEAGLKATQLDPTSELARNNLAYAVQQLQNN